MADKFIAMWSAVTATKKKDECEAASAPLIAAASGFDLDTANAVVGAMKPALGDTNKKNAVHREAGCLVVKAMCAIKAVEPAVMPVLQELLKCTGDGAKGTQAAASAAVAAVVGILSPYAFGSALPQLLAAMDQGGKWQTVVNACEIVTTIGKSEDETVCQAVRNSMPDAIPAILPLLTDFKKEVAEAGMNTLKQCCTLVSNRDLEPLLPVVMSALKENSERSECVQTLASTTFVSTVSAAALSIVMPLLASGFNERTNAVKRQCARIVVNMLKLVEDPMEAKPFLPALDATLTKAKVEVNDPEARAVCESAYDQVARLAATLAERVQPADFAQISARVRELIDKACKLPATPLAGVFADYAAGLCAALAGAENFEEASWTACLVPYLEAVSNTAAAKGAVASVLATAKTEFAVVQKEAAVEEDDGEELCNCKFTLAYGSKILLHNTQMRLVRGEHYGLLGGNDSGKTTLMRAIANDQVDGFPPSTVLKTVFVQADILGDLSHLSCIDYIFEDEKIRECGITKERVTEALNSVGFLDDGKARPNDPVSTLSGGWRMKLALARAMLQDADILLMDEPTNHLDVINVDWVVNYLMGLRGVTSIIVSHHQGLLNTVCKNILQIEDLKLKPFRGNLESFVKKFPAAQSYFDFKASKLSFTFPQPGPIEGIKSKTRALMKMDGVEFTYPGNTKPTITNVTVRASMASRVACVGVNGAGKSTMIKLLTGELEPSTGTVWKHPACRVGYIAQHAFHHIEQHLNKTANEYIQWRYANGDDKETLEKVTMVITEEEEAKCRQPVTLEIKDEDGKVSKQKRVVEKLTGSRRAYKKEHEYEIKWANMSMDANTYLSTTALAAMGFTKHMKTIDERAAIRAGMYTRPATKSNVEKHLDNVGLSAEFGTHHRMSALSGGQKVKVVLAASLWNQPHILILDEPTNYLDRESLGALASAVREYDGGVVMITHNNEFCSDLCPETWVLENGTLDCRGDPEWMASTLANKDNVQAAIAPEDMVDALGNKVKVKSQKKLSNKEKKAKAKQRAFKIANGLDVSTDEDDL